MYMLVFHKPVGLVCTNWDGSRVKAKPRSPRATCCRPQQTACTSGFLGWTPLKCIWPKASSKRSEEAWLGAVLAGLYPQVFIFRMFRAMHICVIYSQHLFARLWRKLLCNFCWLGSIWSLGRALAGPWAQCHPRGIGVNPSSCSCYPGSMLPSL